MKSGNIDAVLSGTLEVPVIDGWANFTDLSISHPGIGKWWANFTNLSISHPGIGK